MLNSVYELLDEELDSLSSFLRRLNREIIPSATVIFGNRPRYDFSEYPACFVLTMELPGIEREDLTIALDNSENTLIITGEKIESDTVKRRECIRKERKYGKFARKIDLPDICDTERLVAKFKQGVLEIEIPKRANAVPENVRRVEIDE